MNYITDRATIPFSENLEAEPKIELNCRKKTYFVIMIVADNNNNKNTS